MDDFSAIANRFEAGLWFLVAAVLAVRVFLSDPRLRKIHGVLAIAFLLFGVSDLIEAHTGAWWRPVWLLLWKGGCLLVISWGFLAYFQAKRRFHAANQENDASPRS